MATRRWSKGVDQSGGGLCRPDCEGGHSRRRLAGPAPERLEDRTLLAGGLPAGWLDPGFNADGWVTAQVGTAVADGAGALQPDGKIVVAGSVTGSGGIRTIALVRYLPDGALDTGFGASRAGIVVLDPGLNLVAARAIALVSDPTQADDGDIVVAGSWADPATGGAGVALARFRPDGSPDTGFGTAGVVRDTRAPGAQGLAIVVESDGIVVGGVAQSGTNAQPIDTAFVERFHADGTPDAGFANPGLDTPLFGGASSTLGGLALETDGGVIAAGEERSADGRSLIATAWLAFDGQLASSFGSGGVATTDPGNGAVVESVDGVAIDPNGRILVAGTARDATSGTEDFFAARHGNGGQLDPAFNRGAIALIDFQRAGVNSAPARSDADFARAIAVQPDGRILVAGETAVPVPGQPGSVGPRKIALARLDPDGTPDVTFGQRGQVVTDLSTPGRSVQGLPRSVLVQLDGNIVVTGTALDTDAGQAFSALAVARYTGSIVPGPGAIPAGVYVEDFANDSDPGSAGFDGSGGFRHDFWYDAQPDGPGSRSDTGGSGWSLGASPGGDGTSLQLTGASDAITFPDLRSDVRVDFASVDVRDGTDAYVTFVGENGTYTAHVGAGDHETVSAGESHALRTDPDGNPTLELGPIREIILDSLAASFDDVKILVIPGQGPLDDFVTVPPGTSTSIDVTDYATGVAAAAGLQPPLAWADFTPSGLPGSKTQVDPSDPDHRILYQAPPAAGPGVHLTDSFGYTVEDRDHRATGTVYLTIDAPPVIAVTHDFPSQEAGDGGLVLKHGTPGPFIGDISLSDAEGDPIALKVLHQALHGQVTLTEISPTHYQYEYDPPAISVYDPDSGLTRTVSDIVGDDRFTIEAGDGISVTDSTVSFVVSDHPPTAGDDWFIVPENVGITYYPTDPRLPHYDPTLARPGLVHFAAPGALMNATDPDGDPLMALADPSHPPQHGRLELLPDGSFNYIPDPGFAGFDAFGFFASDGYMFSAPPDGTPVATPSYVTIDVAAPGPDGEASAPVQLDQYAPPVPGALDPSEPPQGPPNWTVPGPDYASPFTDDAFRAVTVLHSAQGQPSAPYRLEVIFSYVPDDFLHYIEIYSFDNSYSRFISTLFSILDVSGRLDLSTGRELEVSFTMAWATHFQFHGVLTEFLSNIATVHLPVRMPDNRVAADSPFGRFIVESPPGTVMRDVQVVVPSDSGPAGVSIPWYLSFAVSFPSDSPFVKQDAPILVTITLPAGSPHMDTYYKEGPNPSLNPWYPFMYDPVHGYTTGAEIQTDPLTGRQVILLHLVGDGGDFILDPGGPGYFTDPARNFVASLYEDVLGRGPTDAEMAHRVARLDRGESRLKLARAIWDSDEHRRSQVEGWSTQFLGHTSDPRQEARWVRLLRRGRGELAVEQAILTAPDYRRAHPTTASFIAGLNHDVLGQAGDPVDPSHGRLGRHRGRASFGRIARKVLTSPAAAALLARQDAIAFLGRPATAQEARSDAAQLRRHATAPARIAERILASEAFYEFVNSALPMSVTSAGLARHAHHPTRHPRGH